MPTDPQPVDAGELEAFERAIRRAFHEDGHPEDVAHFLRTLEPERTLAVRDGGEIVGGAAVVSRALTVPGGAAVPVAAVTAVGVTPGHTRRGHLGRLMRRQLDDVRAAGDEPIAALWASEGAIYGRFGYGLATRAITYELRLPDARLRADAPVPVDGPRVLAPAGAREAMAGVYDAVRRQRPGMLDRTAPWWEHRLHDPEHLRKGFSPLRAAVQPGPDAEPAGYALYAAKTSWDDSGPAGQVALRELVATTPEARAGLWDHLLHLALMRTLRWRLAGDGDPLPHLLASTDPLTSRAGHGLFVRLVDVDRALAARAYAAPLSVVLDVDDAFCPWNAGRHCLTSDGATARCEPTGDEPDLALAAEALGAAYLGGTSLESLAGAGRVCELRPGALREAALAFRGATEPWCPEIF
jgi:predicted acetyltransferase